MMPSPWLWAPLPASKEQLQSELDYIKRQSEIFNGGLPIHLKMSKHRFPTSFSIWDDDGIEVLLEARRAVIRLRQIWADKNL